jgi:glycosyltransferase involved in cell wall biosynthesis
MTRMPEQPVVSVVIPAYNAAWCVAEAIDSVLAQDYQDFEVIVVDDGSTDDTANVLASYGDSIRVVHQANGGLSNARNAGIREARGEFVAFLDADDWWLPGKLNRQVKLMQAEPALGFCSTAARVEDPQGQLVNFWECPRVQGSLLVHLFNENAAVAGSGSGVLVKRDLLLQVGDFDESLKSLEDIDMWMRLAAVAGYACIPEPLTVLLKHPSSMSRNLKVMRNAAIQVMRKNHPLLPQQLQGGFWRAGMAGIHGDYAKWQYRAGNRGEALLEVFRLLSLAPIKRGRLGLGLLRDMLLGRPL